MKAATRTTAVAPLVAETPLTFGPASRECRVVVGRPIDRQRRRCPLTGDVHHVWVEVASPSGDAPRPTLFSSTRSPAERYRDAEAPAVGRASIDLRPPWKVREEVEALERDRKFGQAALIRAQFPEPSLEVDPEALFPIGERIALSDGIAKVLKIDNDEIMGYVVRHRRGDYGEYGVVRKLELHELEEWAPICYSRLIQNVAAIQAGAGLVVSRYSIFRRGIDEPKHEWGVTIPDRNAAPRRQPDEAITIVTLLSPSRPPRTMVISSRDPSRI